MSAQDAPHGLDARRLRSALEFAVTMAREGQKIKPPLKFPAELRKYFKLSRIPNAALPQIRRIVEGDATFRGRLAVGALPELVDPIGRAWLVRAEGWQDEVARLVAEADIVADQSQATAALQRAERRREAAEQASIRLQAEIVVLQQRLGDRDVVIDGLRSDVVKHNETIDELRAQLVDTRNEARHARDRESAAAAKLQVALEGLQVAQVAQGTAELVRDDVLADRSALVAERSELARLAASAEALAEQLSALAVPPTDGRRKQVGRKALSLPGGVLGSSASAAEFLLRSGASIVVDGYNVAKLAWPGLDCEGQRVVLLDMIENLARRFGSDVTVVFDGADVIGSAADRRRVVRVVFSPDDVIADDVIRDEVRRLPATRSVVVVTNDQAIVRDVRAMGANTIASEQLLMLVK